MMVDDDAVMGSGHVFGGTQRALFQTRPTGQSQPGLQGLRHTLPFLRKFEQFVRQGVAHEVKIAPGGHDCCGS
jgi:hypothetical protein